MILARTLLTIGAPRLSRSPDDCLAQIALDDWLFFSTLFTGDAFCAAIKTSRPQPAFIAIYCLGG
jgi:hypothetical protein